MKIPEKSELKRETVEIITASQKVLRKGRHKDTV